MAGQLEVERRFSSRGIHPYVLFAAPFGLCLIGLGVGGIVAEGANGWSYVATGVFAFAFGAAVLHSCAFSVWGSVTITRQGDRIVACRSLGSIRRSRELSLRQVRHVERFGPGPAALVFPGGAGAHVRVVVERRDRPFAIGEGLSLDDEELKEIETILGRPEAAATRG